MRITMIGAGAFGRALGQVLINNDHEVAFYDKKLGSSLDDALENTEAAVLAVPSNALDDILPLLPADLPLIIATKGITDIHIFDRFNDFSVISGAGFAYDIVNNRRILLTATSKRTADLFTNENFRFDFTDDVTGVLLCGALKNIYAIGAGMRALISGSKEWDEYIDAALFEMSQILALNGANRETVNYHCGVDDLKLTSGPGSRNFEFGLEVRKNPNYSSSNTIEGKDVLLSIKSGKLLVPRQLNILNELLLAEEKWA